MPAERTLSPELQELAGQFEAIRADAARLVDGMTPAQFAWRPAPGRWSAGECLEHLNVVGAEIVPLLDRAIEKTKATGSYSVLPSAPAFVGRALVKAADGPARIKVKTPRKFVPLASRSMDEVVDEFLAMQDHVLGLIGRCEGLRIRKIKIFSPVIPLVRMTLGEWFAYLAAHERRHVWQANEVRNDSSYPA